MSPLKESKEPRISLKLRYGVAQRDMEKLCTQAFVASETLTPLAFQQKILKSYWKTISCGCVFPALPLMLPNPATAFSLQPSSAEKSTLAQLNSPSLLWVLPW